MTQRRHAYDDSERNYIRRLLLRYQEYHRVGVPTLQLRIAQPIGDNNPGCISLKSGQRILAARNRTPAGEHFGSSRHSSDLDG